MMYFTRKKRLVVVKEWLDLTQNQIKDVSPLSGLTNLRSLFLEGNPIASDSSEGTQPNCPISPSTVCYF
ncbi:MAG: leucine-rich repeat domain-containing protein [Symploca sp. SIO3E6]|nr:leucine-rich repeat domain-containing protein [Caldora sp. SIO3E6]